MSFFNDTQEFPALVLTELDVEMLALNMQFSRLDDAIHSFAAADSTPVGLWNGSKIRRFFHDFLKRVGHFLSEAF